MGAPPAAGSSIHLGVSPRGAAAQWSSKTVLPRVFDIIAQLDKHVCQGCLLEPTGAVISGDKLTYQLIS